MPTGIPVWGNQGFGLSAARPSEGHQGCPCPRALSRLCRRCLLLGGNSWCVTAAITLPPSPRFSAGWLRPGLLLRQADPCPSSVAISPGFLQAIPADGGQGGAAPSPQRVSERERCCTQQQHDGKQLEIGAPSQVQTRTMPMLLWSGGAACVLLWPLGTRASGKGTWHHAAPSVAQPANTCAGAHPVGSI